MAGKKHHWARFNFAEWRSDEDLLACSREARSLWLDMCGLIYAAKDRGRLVRANRLPHDLESLNAVLGDDVRVLRRLVTELEAARVFNRDPDGAIVSRRIRREFAAKVKVEAGPVQDDLPGLPPEVRPLRKRDINKNKRKETGTRTHIPEKEESPSGFSSFSQPDEQAPDPARVEAARGRLRELKDQHVRSLDRGEPPDMRAQLNAEIATLQPFVSRWSVH